jgi:hypothetical protein
MCVPHFEIWLVAALSAAISGRTRSVGRIQPRGHTTAVTHTNPQPFNIRSPIEYQRYARSGRKISCWTDRIGTIRRLHLKPSNPNVDASPGLRSDHPRRTERLQDTRDDKNRCSSAFKNHGSLLAYAKESRVTRQL